MSTTQASWRVVCVLVVLAVFLLAGGSALALNKTGHAQSGPSPKLTLLRTHEDRTNGRTMYSYQLEVPDPGILQRDESTLKLSDSAGIVGIGNAIGWRTLSFTDNTGTWQYAGGEPPGYNRYCTFDLEADPERTQPGMIRYHLSADEDTYGVVEGPVALSLPESYQISGTVFLDGDGDGVFDDDEDGIVAVSLSLRDGDGAEVATVVTNAGSYNDGCYLGNYVFDDVEPGSYTVVVTDLLGTLGGLSSTTPTEQDVTVSNADVREVDFGYTEACARIGGRVFFDANRDKQSDDEIEMGFDEVEVTLTWQEDGQPQSETRTTDADGYYDFGDRAPGNYTVAVTGDDKWTLFTYFRWTTPVEVEATVDNCQDLRVDFGAYPRFCKICKAIRCGKITGDNRTIGFWKHNVVRAIHGCTHGIQVTRDELLAYLAAVEELQPFEEPFQFSDDPDEMLWQALWYLHPGMSGNCPFQKLDRQLLAAELNYVSGRNSSEPGLERALIWYAEYVRNFGGGWAAGGIAALLNAWNNMGDC